MTDRGARRGVRWAIVVAAVCAACAACSGANVDAPLPSAPVLFERYAATSVSGGALPATLAETPTTRLRLLGDTLVFSLADASGATGTYVETLVLGTLRPDGTEAVTRSVSSARRWTRTPDGPLTLTEFGGGHPSATIAATLVNPTADAGSHARLTFTTSGDAYLFETP